MIWLTQNGFRLNKHYQRQFAQIISCIRCDDAKDIISEINVIRQQMVFQNLARMIFGLWKRMTQH